MNENISVKRAVILAGGMGTRLRPITTELPKPLVPVAGVPVIKHLIRKAAQAGVTEAVLSAMFMREKLEEKLGKECFGVKLTYVCEPVPLGTAGGARYAYMNAFGAENTANGNDSVIILSGDGIWDFDLADAVRFHERCAADVTIVTVKCDSPTEYGTVNADTDGRIMRFAEKPTWSRVVSDRVNTGVYIMKSGILGHIADGRKYDFSGNLFPELLEGDCRLFAYDADGFWCDIGDPASYYRCNIEALSGHIRGIDFADAYTAEDFVRAEADYTAPVMVSHRTYLGRGAHIGPYTVIGEGCCVGEGSVVAESIVHDNTAIGEGAKVTHAVICEETTVGKNAVVVCGAIIGAHSVIGDGAVIAEGAVLPPHSRIEAGASVGSGTGFGKSTPLTSAEEGYVCDGIQSLVTVGEALAFAAKRVYVGKNELSGRIGVMYADGENEESRLAADTLLCGIRNAGFKSFNYGAGYETMAVFAATYFLSDITVFVKCADNGKIALRIFDRMGVCVSHDFEKAVREYFTSPERGSAGTLRQDVYYRDTESFTGLRFLYYNELLRMAMRDFTQRRGRGLLENITVGIVGRTEKYSPRHMLYRAVLELGGEAKLLDEGEECGARGCIAVQISDNGAEVCAAQGGVYSDKNHVEAILISHCASDVAVPFLSPKAFRSTAKSRVLEYLSDNPGETDVNRERMVRSFWIRDGVFAALRLLCVMAESGKEFSVLYNELPHFSIYVRNVESSVFGKDIRAKVMAKLAERADYSHGLVREREGIELVFDNGCVTVIPKKTGGFRIVGEANDSETACELCAEVNGDIEEMARESEKKSET